MDIDEALQKRLQDFESILEATQNVSYDEPFKWQGKNYNSFRELIVDYTGWDKPCEMDTIYRAWHLELSSLFRSEHFMFFTDVPWVYYIYKDTYLPLSDLFYPDEYSILRDFFYNFVLFAR
ncbi:MAG TPA: hypothetical protein PK723_05940 [Candidatus Pacearchaeota archaeon]|jgi:hypothetical protein|nr:hypothetical protein [Candidatus Pacearchaeota archaeon]